MFRRTEADLREQITFLQGKVNEIQRLKEENKRLRGDTAAEERRTVLSIDNKNSRYEEPVIK